MCTRLLCAIHFHPYFIYTALQTLTPKDMQHGGHPHFLENRVCFAMYSATNAMVRQYRPRLQVYDTDLSAIYCFVGFIRAGQCDADRDWTKNLF